jgi:hypothetical protein
MSKDKTVFENHFEIIEDKRQEKKVMHKLIDILFIAVSGTIANASDWEEIEIFAQKEKSGFVNI